MKFSWGTGIIIFFIIFAVGMLGMVAATYSHPPQLMQEDYYALDLSYQDRLEKKQNAATLAVLPTIGFDASKNSVQIKLPAGMQAQTGTVHCYRSSTTKNDVTTSFSNASETTVSAEDFIPGRWHVELDWVADGKKYFYEVVLVK